MSVSSLPEWKQLLLERKRREEEERDRREREEEERLLSMPAWKRGIIQRRRAAKQEGPGGDRDEKERGDVGDVESYMFSPTGGSGGTGGGCDVIATAEPERPRIELQPLRSFGRVYMENIGPVHQNVFIRSQNSVRRGRLDSDKSGDEQERGGSDGERTGGNVRDERVRGRDVDVKAERYRDRSEGRERDRSAGRERDWSLGRVDSVKGGRAGEGDRDNMRIAKDTQREADFTHHMPGLRTIKAENIIIIEKDRRGNGNEREENDREKLIVEREREVVETEDEEKEDGERGGKGMRMDLREILAGAGCVTEIRATEVLIIKPGTDDKGSTGEGGGGQEVAMRHRRSSSEDNLTDSDRDRGTSDSDRERNKERLRNRHTQDQEQHWSEVKEPTIWLRLPEKELSSSRSSSNRSSTDGGGSSGGGGGGGGGGRVSQLLSKFGERPKPPSRSKSSECFVRPSRGRGERSGTEGSSDDLSPGEEAIAEGKSFRAPGGFPKRSRSFSHRIICARENGLLGVPGYHDGEKPMERKWSDDGRGGEYSERGSKPKVLLRWKHGDKKTNNPADTFERSESVKKKAVNDMANRDKAEVPRQGSIGSVPAIMMTQDDGFTMASVKNVEGIGFARKVSIRQEGKERAAAERETKINEKEANRASEKQAAEQEQQGTDIDAAERQLEREKMIRREKEWERQIELQIEEKKQRNLWRGEADSKPLLCMCVQSSEIANQLYSPNSPSSIVSAAVDFFDFNRSPTVKDVGFSFDRPERDCAGETQERPQAQAVLSQHTEALISKIGSVREKRTEREGRRLTQTCMYVETNMNDAQDGGATKRSAINSTQPSQNSYAGGSSPQYKDEPVAAPKSPLKSPKRCVSVGQSTDPEDIPIPRTVFFGVDMALSERPMRARIPSTDGPEDGGGGGGEGGGEAGRKGVERSDSYRAGRPLTRIESLREKIKQHELERQRISRGVEAKESAESNRGEGGGAGGGEADTDTDTITWISSSSTTTDGGGVNQDKWRDLAHERAMEERRKMGWSMEDMEEMGGGSESASTMTTVSAVTPAAAAQQWRQEEPSVFDDAQEVSASTRANPQLPVPHSALGTLSQSLVAEETQHDSSGSSRGGGGSRSIYIETSVELFSDHGSEDVEVEQLTQQQQHVDQLTGAVGLQAWRHQNIAGGGQDRPTRAVGGGEELEEGEGEEEEEDVDDRGDCHDENYLPPSHTSSSSPASSRSRSPSPLLPLADMSRIYNLKAVGSRAGMCISERPAVEVVSHKPVGRDDYRGFHQKATQESTQDVQGDREKQQPHPWELSDEPLSVTSVQRQVEQLRLREQQEARRQSAAVSEQQQQQFEKSDSKRSQLHHHTDGTSSPRDRASPTGPRTPPAAHRSSAQSTRAFPPSPRLPENARKQLVRPTAPVPPSTPSPSTLSPVTSRTPSPSQSQSPSPSASPCLSPSPSPSPPVISIRSAASGPGKRGTTITITPRKSSPVLGTAAAAVAPSVGSGSPVSSRQADPGQAQAQGDANGTGEGGKKRYPTAEEIQVIGGYQNLEKSCLVKSRGTANKGVKVCFDDSQLERVCEYPSESSLLASLPPSPRLGNPADRGRGEEEEKERERRGRGQKQQKEEDEDEDDEESVLGRNVGSARARVLRVDESCKR